MNTRIRELRLEKNLTQKALGEHLGATQSMLSKIECGFSVPDAILLLNLSQFFNVSTDYILCLTKTRINADSLLAENIHNFKKYQRLISLYQKMNIRQQQDCFTFICSMLGISEDI